jgi:hypothetical protein
MKNKNNNDDQGDEGDESDESTSHSPRTGVVPLTRTPGKAP